MLHIIFAGNPGVGKSLLANTLIGRNAFQTKGPLDILLSNRSSSSSASSPSPSPSPSSPAAAPVLQTVTCNGLKYSDTPGLDSAASRALAAHEISRAVNAETQLKLVFVVTLEAGRVRPADVATVDVILSAVHAVSATVVDYGFSLVINRCDPSEMQLLEDASVREFLALRYAGRFKLRLDNVLCMRDAPELTATGLLPTEERLRLSAFVLDAPVLNLPPPVNVDGQAYDDALRDATNELARLKQELDEVSSTPSWLWQGFSTAVSFLFTAAGRMAWMAVRRFL